jgi:adenine-specific DNA-methyltransferase
MSSINYIGSKKSLKEHITKLILRHTSLDSTKIIGEGFSGTGALAQHLGSQYQCKIICSDTEKYSWLICNAILNLSWSKNLEKMIQELNALEKQPLKSLMTRNYSPRGGRMFFTEENAQRIDLIREEIETRKNQISNDEYLFLLASLVVSTDKFANVSCVYGSFLKEFKKSASNPFVLTPIHTKILIPKHVIHHSSIFSVNWSDCDVLYLDPPYNQRQYGANYFVLNYLIDYSEDQIVRGKTGLIDYYKSPFSQRTNCIQAFEKLFDHIKNVPIIVLSYNNEGILGTEDLENLLVKYGNVTCYIYLYKKFKAQQLVKESSVDEYLWIIETRKNSNLTIERVNYMT